MYLKIIGLNFILAYLDILDATKVEKNLYTICVNTTYCKTKSLNGFCSGFYYRFIYQEGLRVLKHEHHL